MEGGDSEFANFTLPTLKAFFEACSYNVYGNKQQTLQTRDLLVSQKNDAKILFSHPPSPFHSNFCVCNSIGICTNLQF